jgi:predicted O-methyltransferase YrrM
MKFDTDKIGHGYLPVYLALCAQIRDRARVLEIGVANGGSLDLWQALFPGDLIVGVDAYDRARWPEGTVKVVAEQTSEELPDAIQAAVNAQQGRPFDHLIDPFDLIVDDASHDNARTRRTWQLLWPMLVPGGWYVIEDWSHAGGLIYGLAAELLMCFDEAHPLVDNVESITYRPGMIILRKTN